MTLSQAKIDLAVLYKLHQLAEFDAGALSPDEISQHFICKMPLRRIEVALDELQNKGDVDRLYDHFHLDDGVWRVSRQGMARVDRALKVPASFIARIHAKGDQWLETDAANQAVLKKLADAAPDSAQPSDLGQRIDSTAGTSQKPSTPVRSGIDWTKWGTIIAALGIFVSIALWKLS